MNGEISAVIIFVTTIAIVHKFIDIICDKCPKKWMINNKQKSKDTRKKKNVGMG